MALTFDWAESKGTSMQVEPRIIEVRFGDGYAQRSPAGINHMPDLWNMVFTGCYPVEGDTIVGFFEQHAGHVPFLWTPPRKTVPALYICRRWGRSLPDLDGLTDITATFERDYQP